MRCQGEAHSNSFIDNCGLCAPNWGWIPSPRPTDAIAAVKRWNSVNTWEWITIYRTAALDLEEDRDTRYTVTCEAHNQTIASSSQRKARHDMQHPEEWCSRCAGLELGTWIKLYDGTEGKITGRVARGRYWSGPQARGWSYYIVTDELRDLNRPIHDTDIEYSL